MCTLGFAGREEGENRRGMGRKEGGGGVGVWEDSWMVVIRDYGSLVGDDESSRERSQHSVQSR